MGVISKLCRIWENRGSCLNSSPFGWVTPSPQETLSQWRPSQTYIHKLWRTLLIEKKPQAAFDSKNWWVHRESSSTWSRIPWLEEIMKKVCDRRSHMWMIFTRRGSKTMNLMQGGTSFRRSRRHSEESGTCTRIKARIDQAFDLVLYWATTPGEDTLQYFTLKQMKSC